MALAFLSNDDMYGRIYQSCRDKRLLLNMTQAELAKRSGLSLRTIKSFESGQSVTLMSLVKIMRALGEFHRLEHLVVESSVSAKEIFLNDKPMKKKRARRAAL